MRGLFKLTRLSSTLQRKPYAKLEELDINHFRNILGAQGVVTDPAEIQPHNSCWRNIDHGNSELLLLPKNTKEVSAILSHCS